jgi:hypothetical protein
MNRLLAQTRADGYFAIRTFHRKRKGTKDPRFLFKCGCCTRDLEVYYGEDSLEINGVMGSVDNWRKLLMPLLEMKLPGQGQHGRGRIASGYTRRRTRDERTDSRR